MVKNTDIGELVVNTDGRMLGLKLAVLIPSRSQRSTAVILIERFSNSVHGERKVAKVEVSLTVSILPWLEVRTT